ncbi:MAG TPA: carboxypeptidase regulatory-like domain-containing protein [Candidatus Sulfopaludibacter sp.]|nr:carboxypeptidase regulatory-like domain-containing protein [Candidatus Sulfopaludibacter sp.]
MKPHVANAAALAVLLMAALSGAIPARPQQDERPLSPESNALGPPATVHGMVKNALTGEPLPRALVLVDGQGGVGALTDGDGRFELSGVPLGPNVIQITRPGFEDAAGAPPGVSLRDLRGFSHNVFVTANTPELDFSLRPTNSIRGRVDLSTGDPANNSVSLLRREIGNGRAVWHPVGGTRVNADGVYHFAHLQDGDYAVAAEPAPDSDTVLPLSLPDSGHTIAANWYPQIYYPDARDFSGAAHIHISGGEQAQANLTLPLEAFHRVSAALQLPGESGASGNLSGVQAEIATQDGHHLPYPAVYNKKENAVDALLPDGSYALHVTAFNAFQGGRDSMSSHGGPAGLWEGTRQNLHTASTGQLDFTVAGRALGKLRIPVGPQTPTPLQVDVSRAGSQTSSAATGRGEVFVEISQAGPLTDGMQSVFAQGQGPGNLNTLPPSPGRYWVRTVVAQRGLCESSFTAGGANLGREPLTVGPGGVTAPLTLTLRDDCASLQVSLPPNQAGMTVGEEPAYTVYVVPDFDFTTEARSITLRASTGGTFTFNSLTPGSYHVYTFSAPVDLEYHNSEALASLAGQAVTLAPDATQNLTLEAPAP